MTTPNDAPASGTNSNAGPGSGAPAGTGAPGSTGAAAGTPAAGTPAAGTPAAGAGNADERYGSPEKYDPKGAENFTDALRDGMHAYGKKYNLSQKAVSEMYDIANKNATTQEEKLTAAHQANLKQWAEESKADAEFGGEKYDANVAVAMKGIETFGTPKLQEILKGSGLDKNPEFFRLFYRVGKAVSEDKFVRGGSSGGDAGGNSGLFSYPNSKHNS